MTAMSKCVHRYPLMFSTAIMRKMLGLNNKFLFSSKALVFFESAKLAGYILLKRAFKNSGSTQINL